MPNADVAASPLAMEPPFARSASLAATLARPARLLFWPALVFAAAMAVWPQAPKLALGDYADKWTHVLAFAVLTALAQVGFTAAGRWRIALWLCLFGAAIEVAQALPGLNREASLPDWLADAATVALLTGLALVLDRRDAGRNRPSGQL